MYLCHERLCNVTLWHEIATHSGFGEGQFCGPLAERFLSIEGNAAPSGMGEELRTTGEEIREEDGVVRKGDPHPNERGE